MKLKKDSWHYRLVSEVLSDNLSVGQMSICQYFWAVVLSIIVNVIMCCAYVIIATFSVLFARLPDFECDNPKAFKPIKNYPKIGRFTPRPIYIILLGLLVWQYDATLQATKVLATSQVFWGFVGSFFGSLLVLGMIVLALNAWRKNEIWKIFKAFIKAKKTKICPFIEFE